MKMIKNTNFMIKNNNKQPKKYLKALSNIFLRTCHTDPWCNMLQTLERQRKYIGDILSNKHTRKYFEIIEAAIKYVLQNSQENTCARVSFLIKLQAKRSTGEILLQNSCRRLVPNHFLFFTKALKAFFEVKTRGLQLIFNVFR